MPDPKPPKRVTLYDVAQAAGVSHQTVSRVINNYPHISAKTRHRVLRAITALGYRPNRAAQILNTQRSYTLEVVIRDIWGSSAPTLSAMAVAARQFGYQLTISAITQDDLAATLSSAPARMIDGLVLSSERFQVPDDDLLALAQTIPVIKMKGEPVGRVASVVFDQHHGARTATQHLIDLGHHQIAEITGPLHLYDARARHESWRMTLVSQGLEPGPSVAGDFTYPGGYQAMCRLLDGSAPFTAVFVGNDDMALGAMFAIHERGQRVPDDISLVGFDDIPSTPYFTVPLTTVRQDGALIGSLGIEYLVSLIEKPHTPVHQRILLPQLVVRQSTRRIL